MKTQDIYRIMYHYKGTAYQSMKYFKTKEKATSLAMKHDGAKAVIWLRKENGSEILVYCFELVKERQAA